MWGAPQENSDILITIWIVFHSLVSRKCLEGGEEETGMAIVPLDSPGARPPAGSHWRVISCRILVLVDFPYFGISVIISLHFCFLLFVNGWMSCPRSGWGSELVGKW